MVSGIADGFQFNRCACDSSLFVKEEDEAWSWAQFRFSLFSVYLAVAYLMGAPPHSLWPNMFSISCSFFFWTIWQTCMLASPWRVGAPSYGESWIRPCLECYGVLVGSVVKRQKNLRPACNVCNVSTSSFACQ